jgi:ribosomal subunit interface protein
LHVYLTARHLELTDELRAYVEKRIVEPLRTLTRLPIPRVEIQLYTETDRGPQAGCHLLVELKGHHDINVREVASDLHAAIDLAADRARTLVVEHRDKLLTLSRHPKKYSIAKLARALGIRRHEPA